MREFCLEPLKSPKMGLLRARECFASGAACPKGAARLKMPILPLKRGTFGCLRWKKSESPGKWAKIGLNAVFLREKVVDFGKMFAEKGRKAYFASVLVRGL
jgi:hypothetical protein